MYFIIFHNHIPPPQYPINTDIIIKKKLNNIICLKRKKNSEVSSTHSNMKRNTNLQCYKKTTS